MLGLSLFFLGRLTVGTSPVVVALAMALQGMGMGVFYTPNTASVLSVVEQRKYGVATAFLNMTRNTANVTGVGLTTTIVTMAMAARGFEPSLDAVASGAMGVEAAFTHGLRLAFMALGAFILLSIALIAFKPSAAADADVAREEVGEPSPQSSGGD